MTIQTLSKEILEHTGLWDSHISTLQREVQKVGCGLELKLDDGLGEDDNAPHLVVVQTQTVPGKKLFFGLFQMGSRTRTFIVCRIYTMIAHTCRPYEGLRQYTLERLAAVIEATSPDVEVRIGS